MEEDVLCILKINQSHFQNKMALNYIGKNLLIIQFQVDKADKIEEIRSLIPTLMKKNKVGGNNRLNSRETKGRVHW